MACGVWRVGSAAVPCHGWHKPCEQQGSHSATAVARLAMCAAGLDLAAWSFGTNECSFMCVRQCVAVVGGGAAAAADRRMKFWLKSRRSRAGKEASLVTLVKLDRRAHKACLLVNKGANCSWCGSALGWMQSIPIVSQVEAAQCRVVLQASAGSDKVGAQVEVSASRGKVRVSGCLHTFMLQRCQCGCNASHIHQRG